MAASAAHRVELQQVAWSADQDAMLVDPSPDFISVLAAADLVVSAGGTTVYELMALGRPSAICTVAANQERNYAHLVEAGLAVGLGPVAGLHADPASAAAQLAGLLHDGDRLAQIASAGFGMVDGRGRRRVADRLLSLSGSVSRG
jgi:spore coat polysaccharide biosynthesis predicted glycosyltransferase SpsG